MPHKVGSKWKWGNVERSSKKELLQTVYGIWKKNGGKGSFSKFWRTGSVSESEGGFQIGLSTRPVPKDALPALLDSIGGYCTNERFSREQFEKYLGSMKEIDGPGRSMYYGLFDGDMCMALSYLNKVPEGCICVAELQCIQHGFGRILLDDIVSKSKAVWLVADPSGGEKLLEYYRSFGFEETLLDRGGWGDPTPRRIFYKTDDQVLRDRILKSV